MSVRIGCRAHAVLAASDGVYSHPDFDYAGEGCTRVGWLHKPTGVIYKAPKNPWSWADNNREFDKYKHIEKRKIDGWRIPITHRFIVKGVPIIAMEYVGQKAYAPTHDERAVISRAWNIGDCFAQNVRILPCGTKVMVDLAG